MNLKHSVTKACACYIVALQYGFQELEEILKKDFTVSVCSEHFQKEDFVCLDTSSRRLKPGASPSVFSWTRKAPERSLPEKKNTDRKAESCL